ncbi:MAG TPA: glycosyltransferase family 4 protein [Tepidisphaeraceae bacterium]|nr:glycosyltransferase family 4 protein [Tepidisphaeraceae bacterium]
MADPVFAFLALTSGSYEGAIIKDIRLANELHARGFRVIIYWMLQTNRSLANPQIPQRVLCNGTRYQMTRPSNLLDRAGALLSLYSAGRRRRFIQEHSDYVARVMCNLMRAVCDGDPNLERRLERFIVRDGVTHLLPTFAFLCPWAQAVKERGRAKFDYLVEFKGEEIFANYAQEIGRLDEYYARLRQVTAASRWPAIAVSRDYALRLQQEIGIEPSRLLPIYPGIELPPLKERPEFSMLLKLFPRLRPDLPIVTYFGRQDSEKGIDLLLYAAKLLAMQGVQMQLLVCGGSSFGWKYGQVCREIAGHLRLFVRWKRRLDDDMREALYAHSRCVVYPSIHREPFGMVAPEAMSHGTPVLVPDHGGIAETLGADGQRGGLTFKAWDTADLAAQLKRLLVDDMLHARLSSAARSVAANFSIANMADRTLEHMGIGTRKW